MPDQALNIFVVDGDSRPISDAQIEVFSDGKRVGHGTTKGYLDAPVTVTLDGPGFRWVTVRATVEGVEPKTARIDLLQRSNHTFHFNEIHTESAEPSSSVPSLPANPSTVSSSSPTPPSRLQGQDPVSSKPSWIFGSLLIAFLIAVFVFAPAALPDFKQRLLAFMCALLAGFFAFFFTGNLAVSVSTDIRHGTRLGIQATGGLAAFTLVLFWWFSPAIAPIKKTVHAAVSVSDARTKAPISRANVTFDEADEQKQSASTDHSGLALADVAPGKMLAISAEADGYSSQTVSRQVGNDDLRQEISLELIKSQTIAIHPPRVDQRTGRAPDTTQNFTGTWRVEISGNILNARIRSGTFDFRQQPDSSVIVSGNYNSDGMSVTCKGTGAIAGKTLSIEFSASNREGGSWTGTGELTLYGSRLRGRWESKLHDFFPVELRRISI